MANKVYTTEEIGLSDDTTVSLKPSNIKILRKGMAHMEKFGQAENQDDTLDALLDAAAVCLSPQRPEFYDTENDKHTDISEEVLELDTVYKVIEVCLGIKLNDPDLIKAAVEAATAEAAGTPGTN